MPKTIDLSGQQFGDLTAIQIAGRNRHNKRLWLCDCSCGKQSLVSTGDLRSGHTTTCGCGKIRALRAMGRAVKGNYRTVNPDYRAAHLRVKHARGPARNYSCEDCGKQATDWAYDHLDVNALTGQHRDYTVTYSADPQHYRPLCRPCHRKFDKENS